MNGIICHHPASGVCDCERMRRVSLREESPVFQCRINRTLYMLLKNHKSDFLRMIKDQTPAFWVAFTVTLWEVQRRDNDMNVLIGTKHNLVDRFFIGLHDVLISKRPEHVVTYINDVVAMARYGKFMSCIDTTLPEYQNISERIDGMASFKRLFGGVKADETMEMVLMTHVLHLYATGGLLGVFRLWLGASGSARLDWAPPESWYHSNEMLPFLAHLKKRWGKSLYSMLAIKDHTAWWNSVDMVEFTRKVDWCYTVKSDRPMGLRNMQMIAMGQKMLLSDIPGVRPEFRLLVCLREMYIAEESLVFHPYAQFPACVYARSVGPWLWRRWDKTESSSRDCLTDIAGRKNWVTNVIHVQIEVRQAMTLDPSFHNTVASAETWTSPEVLARLPWNMTLCLSWLEWALVQTYAFESSFLAVCHFPVRKSVARLLERMLATLSHEPRLLAKAAIIVAEKIWLDESNGREGAHKKSRELLKFCLERLAPKMKSFNDGSSYALLKWNFNPEHRPPVNPGRVHGLFKDIRPCSTEPSAKPSVVVETGWTAEERTQGEISIDAQKEDFRFLRDANTANINIDLCFSENYRSTGFWFKMNESHTIERSEHYFEACKKIEAFKKAVGNFKFVHRKNNSTGLEFDQLYYRKFSNAMGPTVFRAPESIFDASTYMHASGLLQESVLFQFNYCVLEMMSQLQLPELVVHLIPGIEILRLFNANRVAQYFKDIPVAAKQDLLGHLLMKECLRLRADLNGRLCAVFNMFNQRTACPAPKFFSETCESIAVAPKGAAVISSVGQADAFLDTLTSRNVIVDGPCEDPLELSDVQMRVDPVRELEKKRAELLAAVSWAQYRAEAGGSGEPRRYPLLSELEYRLPEELAALRKARETGCREASRRLQQLLVLRVNRAVASCRRWRAGDERGAEEASGPDLLPRACNLRSRVLAVLLELRAVCLAYLSPLLTTHPFCESSERLLLRLVEVLLSNCQKSDTVAYSAQLCAALESTGLAYLEQLLEDCLRAWSVPAFYADPACVPDDAMKHAQLLHGAGTHLLLHVAERGALVGDLETARMVPGSFAQLLRAGVLLLKSAAGDAQEGVPGAVARLYCAVFSDLKHLVRRLQPIRAPTRTGWRGCSPEWTACLRSVADGSVKHFVRAVQLKEFVNKATATAEQSASSGDNLEAVSSQQKSAVDPEEGSGDATNGSKAGMKAEPRTTACTNDIGQENTTKEDGSRKEKKSKKGKNKNSKEKSTKFCTNHSSIGKKNAASGAVKKMQNLHLNCCFGCEKMEQSPGTFMKCEMCVSEKWTVVRVYCSSECRSGDWACRHGTEHSEGERESDYAGQGHGID
ncbi:uncharacterized protein LOC134532109 isoform X2 [Bacillus rossius redtenbacheri]|uniref:uncharacterized protein LOC134532109 isoform X2 n=1 Tax=Bacillus rossius redtenbacheri TaxID=93214 RepID=UPI002FDD7860